jgi:hypothetical protein
VRKRRKRQAAGIYRDKYGIYPIVKVGERGAAPQVKKRFQNDTPAAEIQAWRDATRVELRATMRSPGRLAAGTLEADAKIYLGQVGHLASYKSRLCEVDAWVKLYGRLRREHISERHVREARATWVADQYTPKTINNRVQTLRHLYRVLDGKRRQTPADDVDALVVPASPKVNVDADVFRAVAIGLAGDLKTRARFMVLAATGVRPATEAG